MTPRRPYALAAAALALSAATTSPLMAQGVRGEISIRGSSLELRPLVRDSLPESSVSGQGIRRVLPDGTRTTCTPDLFCQWFASSSPEMFSVVTQEIRATGWGFVPRLSTHVHLRGRYGSDEFWPLTNQEFEAVAAYVNWEHPTLRARGGRITRTDGLGYYNFDGASVLWRGLAPMWVELYGGWSLARGLNAPRTGNLLQQADDLPPDERGLIFGGQLGVKLSPRVSGTVMYQRQIRSDRLALYSERASLDLHAAVGRASLGFSSEYDWANDEFNEIKLRASTPLPGGFDVSATARHYSPFFELWTIWGAFSPTGFDEGLLSVGWSNTPAGIRLEAGGGYRDYEDTGITASGLRENGWRAFTGFRWQGEGWFANGSYAADVGFGAARFGGDLSAGRTFGEGTFLSVRGSRTQTFGELRFNEQYVSGLGVDGALTVGEATLTAGASVNRLDGRERPADADWTQTRVYAGLSMRFGTEPSVRHGSRGP
ncbi:MAG: hypothetical protein ABFS14_02855 [Gemmatimonadota bacterium]